MRKELGKNALIKLSGYGIIGVFFFFIPVTISGKSTIPLDHIVTFLKTEFPTASGVFALITILLGAAFPFVSAWASEHGAGAGLSGAAQHEECPQRWVFEARD